MSQFVSKVLSRQQAVRVARRFVFAGLADQFQGKVHDLLNGPLSASEGRALADWLSDNFHFEGSKTPKGGKALKELLQKFHWFLNVGLDQANPETQRDTIESVWEDLQPQLGLLVKLFSEEGGKVVPKEITLGGNLYKNLSGFPEKALRDYAKALESVFEGLKGWRKKALSGGVVVALAGPQEFRGTTSGKYKSNEDILYVRATPNILKRSRGSYASFDYIITHELGHRYEYKHPVRADFDQPEWYTSAYSRTEGEAFAELFALSNFDLKGPWNSEVLDRFEDRMA